MRDFILYIAQSGICLSLFGIVYFLFLRGQTFFRFNRMFLLLGLLISFILPAIQFSYDVVILALPMASIPIAIWNGEVATVGISLWEALTIGYLLGIVVLFVRNICVFWKLYKLKQSSIVSTTATYSLVDNKKIKTPFSILTNVFINTSKLQDKEREIILKHEISHIDQKHWIDLLCSECALLLQWFNPMMWCYIHFLKENHEYLADQAVLNDGESTVVYRAVLINQRFQGPVFSFANSFNYSNQQNRLEMMKKTKTSPWKKFGALAVLPLIGAFLALSAKPNYVVEEVSVEVKEKVTEKTVVEDSSVVVIGYKAEEKPLTKTPLMVLKKEDNPLIIVDGEATDLKIEDIDSESVKAIEVLKDKSATDLYGEKAKDGVIKVTTKKNNTPAENPIFHIRGLSENKNILIIIDGEEASKEEMGKKKPETIKSISILKDKAAIDVYGDKGKDGVIIIESKE